jgi:PRTRC genetic system protein C
VGEVPICAPTATTSLSAIEAPDLLQHLLSRPVTAPILAIWFKVSFYLCCGPILLTDNGKEREVSKSMTIETMAREFRYDGVRLPDPNPKLSVEEVRTAFSATYPEIATAAVTGPEAVGNKLVYHFAKAIGTKG